MNCIYLFLPVYNRGRLTANFLEHVAPLIPAGYQLKPILLDDGCTDNTVELATRAYPSMRVVKLSGSHYWGGALNEIASYIRCLHFQGQGSNIYMICNDDVRFHPDSFATALPLVRDDLIISPVTALVNDNFNSPDSVRASSYSIFGVDSMYYFDRTTGSFKATNETDVVNICETRAMLTKASPWLNCPLIPSSVPHYLSDYWLTYEFFNRGYQIKYPYGFICYNSILTSKNKPYVSSSGKFVFNLEGVCERIKTIALSCLWSVPKTSPSYAPAWITFLSKYSRQQDLSCIILKHRIKFLVGSIVFVLKGCLGVLKPSSS